MIHVSRRCTRCGESAGEARGRTCTICGGTLVRVASQADALGPDPLQLSLLAEMRRRGKSERAIAETERRFANLNRRRRR